MRLQGLNYQQDKLREINKYQDTLDIFIHILMIRLPTAFTLVNMILMIWLVQTIFSSLNADLIPKSLYFYAPLLNANPIIDISFSDGSCINGYTQITLKTFPTLTAQSIRHLNLTKWKQQKVLCIKTSEQQANFSRICQKNQLLCTGICVKQASKCPITGIKKINSIEIVSPSQQVFYNSSDKLYKYVLFRQQKNTFIIGISAQYQYQCANQFKYFQTFSNFGSYWNQIKECGKEGSLSSETYHSFDSLPTLQFFMANGLWSQSMNETWASSSITTLGYINKIQYKTKLSMCTNAQSMAKELSKKIHEKPLQPLFSKSLLIISFVFFTVCWAWLLAFYCCQVDSMFKNTFIILLAIIQFITVAFIYHQNSDQFQLQNLILRVSQCVDQNIPAFQNWSFGLSNRYPLISIMFVCCSFVLLQGTSYFMSCFVYQIYTFSRVQSLFGSKSYISEGDFN